MAGLILFARIILGGVFLMSALAKLPAPAEFVANVRKYRILPHPVATGYGQALPYAELGAGSLLLLGMYPTWAALAAALMLVSFVVAVGIVMARRQYLECYCFGLLYREQVGWTTQVRDGVLLLLALFILLADDGSITLGFLVANASHPGYALAIVATIAVLALSLLAGYLALREERHRRSLVRSHLGPSAPG